MKKTTTILMLLFALNGFAQSSNDTIYFSTMTKVDLAKVYLTEVQRVTKKLNVCTKIGQKKKKSIIYKGKVLLFCDSYKIVEEKFDVEYQ